MRDIHNKEIAFIYISKKGNLSFRRVLVRASNNDCIQGICLNTNAFKTFSISGIIETDPVDVEMALAAAKEQFSEAPRTLSTKNSYEICFTGYAAAEKVRLKNKAEEAGFIIRSKVTKHLGFLCCGPNAGPKKKENALNQATCCLDDKQTINLLETGEIPVE